jgi:Flp pilus assembly pilin Flp
MTPCVEWTGWRDPHGYGLAKVGPGTQGRARAHRVVWKEANGPIPDGMCVLHRCDNPSCVNVDHLWLGTVAENNRDRSLKGRSSHRSVNRGVAHGQARLTEETVLNIRKRYAAGDRRRKAIAASVGVSVGTVRAVIDRQSWAWLRDEEAQGLAEYSLILALIAIVAIIALLFIGGAVSNLLSSVGQSI